MQSITPIPLVLLHTGKNVRIRQSHEEIRLLANSLTKQGQLVPILVGLENTILDGHRRFQAAQLAGLESLDAIVLDHNPDPAELKMMQLSINCQRADFSPLDKAKAYEEVMILKQWNASQLAESLQLANSTVTTHLSLLKLPVALQQWVNEGKLDVSKAYYLTRIDDLAEQERIANELLQGRLSRDSLAAKVRKQPSQSSKFVQKRITFHVQQGVTISVSSQELTLERLAHLLSDLSKQVRKAQSQHIAVTTLAKQLADQAKILSPTVP